MKKKINDKFKILGKNISNLRKKYNFSLEELSLRTGIRRQYLKKIEEGNALGVSMSHLEKLTDVFGGRLSDILKGL